LSSSASRIFGMAGTSNPQDNYKASAEVTKPDRG
jgi:hypothetical protein